MTVLAARIKAAQSCAQSVAGKEDLLDASVQALTAAVFELFSAESDGGRPVLDPRDAKILSETLRNIALTRKSMERKAGVKTPGEALTALERVRAVYRGEG